MYHVIITGNTQEARSFINKYFTPIEKNKTPKDLCEGFITENALIAKEYAYDLLYFIKNTYCRWNHIDFHDDIHYTVRVWENDNKIFERAL